MLSHFLLTFFCAFAVAVPASGQEKFEFIACSFQGEFEILAFYATPEGQVLSAFDPTVVVRFEADVGIFSKGRFIYQLNGADNSAVRVTTQSIEKGTCQDVGSEIDKIRHLGFETDRVAEIRRQNGVLNRQVSDLRDHLDQLQALLDLAMEKDAASLARIESLSADLAAALARTAIEAKK